MTSVHDIAPRLAAIASNNGWAEWYETGTNGRPRFVAPRLAEALRAETPTAVGGELVYAYRAGAYRPNGEDDLRARIAAALGDAWKSIHAEEVLKYLRATSPPLDEAPPRDRINVQNGILDLDTGRLESHTPELLSPVQLATAYDPDATCPQIDAFLAASVPTDCIRVVHELVGYLVTPDNSLQRAVMLVGPGGTGKSTLLNVIRALLGKHNVSAVALHQLEDDRFATADLYGRLANVFADLDARALQSSSIFKSITGGDAIRAERKHRSPFTFEPYCRLLFSANAAPPTTDSSQAFFDRWLVLPLEHRFRGAEVQDRHLIDALTTQAEISGLLNHGLRVLPEVQQHGFTIADSIKVATERFHTEVDSVAGFLDENGVYAPGYRIAKPKLYRSYKAWCDESNRRPLSAQRVNPRIRELYPDIGETVIDGTRHWIGVTLKDASA